MNVLRKFLGEDDSDNWFVVCHNESKVKENEYGFFINFSKGDDVKQKLKEEFRYAF